MIRKYLNSIFFKVFIKTSLLMIVLTLLIHALIYNLFGAINTNIEEKKIESSIVYVENILNKLEKTPALNAIEQLALALNINISIDYNGDIFFYKSKNFVLDTFFEYDENINIQGGSLHELMLVKTKQFTKNNDKIKIQLVKSILEVDESRNASLSFMPYTITIALLISIIFSYFFTNSITKPILSIEKTLKDMNNLVKDARVNIKSKDEFENLGKNINKLYINLLNGIEEYKKQNKYVLNMEKDRLNFLNQSSHELKTPITKLSVLIENMLYNVGKYKDRDVYLEEAYEITSYTSNMINNLLSIIKKNNLNKNIDLVNLKNAINLSLENYNLLFDYNNILINADCENLEIYIDENDLDILLSNLLSNAVKYSQPNSIVDIYCDKNLFSISNIINDNKNIENSSGLGLEIIKSICKKYNIKLNISQDIDEFEVSLDLENIVK